MPTYTASGTNSPINFTGIPAGTYAAVVTAHNSVGNGIGSTSVNVTVTSPITVSTAPTITSVVAGNASATVTFTAPSSNGGAAITGYTAISSPGNFTGTAGSVAPIVVGGLTNGTAYTFTVIATNSVGNSSASASSSPVTPAASANLLPAAQANGTSATSNYKTGSNAGTLPTLATETTIVPSGVTGSIKAILPVSPSYVGPSYAVLVTPGTTISGLVSMYAATRGTPIAPQISFFSDTNAINYVSNSTGTVVNASQSTWTNLTMTATVPAGVQSAQIQGNAVLPAGNPSGDIVYLSKWELANGTVTTWTPGS